MTDVEVYRPRSLAPVGPQELDTMIRQADLLSQSSIIPRDYRGKPENVLVAAMTGRTFGWDVMTALRNGHVIEGIWALRPEAMLGLIRQAGHKVNGSMSPTAAKIHGRRCDTGDELEVEFTLDDAVTAGLCTIKDGKPYARSSTGKRLPWEQYPQAMCWWRAVAMLARALFSDVTLGLSYTPEELGAEVDADGCVIDAQVRPQAALSPAQPEGPRTLSKPNIEALETDCANRGIEVAKVVRLATDGRTDNPYEVLCTEVPALRQARDAIAELSTDETLTETDPEPQGNAGFDYEQDPGGGPVEYGPVDPAEARRAWDEEHTDEPF